MNAGSSLAGIDFSARAVDVSFVGMGTYEMGQASADAARQRAREAYGRSISTMTYASRRTCLGVPKVSHGSVGEDSR